MSTGRTGASEGLAVAAMLELKTPYISPDLMSAETKHRVGRPMMAREASYHQGNQRAKPRLQISLKDTGGANSLARRGWIRQAMR